jgi:hypothetical protein
MTDVRSMRDDIRAVRSGLVSSWACLLLGWGTLKMAFRNPLIKVKRGLDRAEKRAPDGSISAEKRKLEPVELEKVLFESMTMPLAANTIHHIDEIARISGIKPIRVCELLLQTYQEAEQEKPKPRSPRRCHGVRKRKNRFPTKRRVLNETR